MTKPVLYEKSIDLVIYKQSSLESVFVACGFDSMLFPPTTAYPQLIQQFYANFDFNNSICTSFVKGKLIEFSADILGDILAIPFTGPCPFTLKGPLQEPFSPIVQLQIVLDDFTITDLYLPTTVDVSPLSAVIHKILRANLLPRTGGGANFTFQDLALVSIILKGLKFNLALMMLLHMDSCVKQNKKCLPYGGILTKIFQHFDISFENETFITLTDSIDSANLKMSHLAISDGVFIRSPKENTLEHLSHSTSAIPPSASSDISSLLQQILANQNDLKTELREIKLEMKNGLDDLTQRLTVLESRTHPVTNQEATDLFKRVEDEFIDLQAGFEISSTAMVAAMHRKLNRNTCQLSQELKFVSNQLGSLGHFSARRFNDISRQIIHSPVPEWPEINWMAEFAGDFLDLQTDPAIHIPRPPRFARDLSLAERLARIIHRPYFTRRAQHNVVIVDLDD